MLSDLTPKEKMQLDTQKGLHFGLREHIDMVIEEQVIKLNNEMSCEIKTHNRMTYTIGRIRVRCKCIC